MMYASADTSRIQRNELRCRCENESFAQIGSAKLIYFFRLRHFRAIDYTLAVYLGRGAEIVELCEWVVALDEGTKPTTIDPIGLIGGVRCLNQRIFYRTIHHTTVTVRAVAFALHTFGRSMTLTSELFYLPKGRLVF